MWRKKGEIDKTINLSLLVQLMSEITMNLDKATSKEVHKARIEKTSMLIIRNVGISAYRGNFNSLLVLG